MKKKLMTLLMTVVSVVALVACVACGKTYTVTYVGVAVTEVEPTEEGGETTYTYVEETVGTETVKKGGKITGVATASDGTMYIADKYFVSKEVNVEATAVYDASTAIKADVSIYAENTAYAIYQALATGSGYTLNYPTTTFPNTWNSHIYETNTDSTILGYASTGFYEFDYNEAKDGYKWVDGMAVGDPVDVTSQYVGEEWGIEEGDTARAWQITIRNDLCWDDGTAITSADFVSSAVRLLNPLAQNSRADDYTYGGSFVVHNAENYILQGSWVDQPYGKYYETAAEAVAGAAAKSKVISLNLTACDEVFENEWIGASLTKLMGNEKYYKTYIEGYFTIYKTVDGERVPETDDSGNVVTFFSKYNVVEDTDGMIEFTQQMWEDYSNCDVWNPDPDAELGLLCTIPVQYDTMSFDSVGIKATSPTTIVYIIDQELSGFYLKYALSTYLVKTDVYDACDNITFASATDNIGSLPAGEVYKSTYCTDSTNSPSYGPYKLTQYQLDKYFKLEKNTNWWGYKDEENKGLYQTTAIVYTMATSASTRLQMFLSGQFDSYGLSSDDMDEYGSSDYTYYTDGDSTWFLAFNPNQEAYHKAEYEGGDETGTHKAIDKEILSIKEFRQALSYALNRAEYELACDPTGNVAKALFSPMIISDPENGTVYRTTDAAKQAVVKFWGVEDQIGEGKLYATIDDAIDSITGYNLAMAKEYFNTAYDKAVELGYIADGEVVEICIGTPNLTSNYYNKGYDFLVNCYTEAVKGTKLEGKLTFTRDGTLNNDFGPALRNHQVDMLFGVGWTGSALDPYGLVEVYTTYDNRYSVDTDYTKISAEITLPVAAVEGKGEGTAVYSASVASWSDSLKGSIITVTKGIGDDIKSFEVSFGTTAEYSVRGLILAAIEVAVLEQYEMIPIAYDSSAAMKGMKVNYYTEDYIYGVGRGGIKYMSFNYTDSEWAAYVASQGGKLNYKASAE